jgi:hypothetical protein
MTMRTSAKTVTFKSPFFLIGLDEVQPSGVYSVETDEQVLEGVSFLAYRRVSTWICRHAKPGDAEIVQTLNVDSNELDAALVRDVDAGARAS